MGVNALRSHLCEFGIVVAKGIGRIDELIEKANDDAMLPGSAKAALQVLIQQLEAIGVSIAALDQEIARAHAQNPVSRLLAGIPGIGKITAAAIVASAPDPNVFKSGRDFSAWLGATPRQNSSGGKEKLGSITKQGNRYIRRLLVLGGAIAASDCGGATSLARAWRASGKVRFTRLAGRASRAQTREIGHGGAWPSSSRGSSGPS